MKCPLCDRECESRIGMDGLVSVCTHCQMEWWGEPEIIKFQTVPSQLWPSSGFKIQNYWDPVIVNQSVPCNPLKESHDQLQAAKAAAQGKVTPLKTIIKNCRFEVGLDELRRNINKWPPLSAEQDAP